jgi:D-glycero-alpha-D-manno-heptose-7-phosphate kinase
MKIARARSPVRIDLAGGWTDVPPFSQEEGGCVVNAAISRYAYATVIPVDNGEFVLESADYDSFIQAQSIRQMEYDGNLDLIKAAIRRRGLHMGAHILTRSEAPPGSGTGSSASMGVTMVGIIDHYMGRSLDRMDIAALANLLEIEELKIPGGKQDQYVAALGGFNFMSFKDPQVTVEPIKLSEEFLLELEKHMLLVYTGKSRLSGNIIARVMGAYQRNEPGVTEALRNISQAAVQMRDALAAEDIVRVGKVLTFNWENQKCLYPEMTTPKIEALFSVAAPEGILGGKACGAGGGGCILLLCKPDCEHRVRRAVEDLGGHCIDFEFDHKGLQVWDARS